MHNEFSQRLAVVTGCSSGIGLEVCRLLLEAGTRVVGMSRTLGELAPLQHAYPQQLHWLAGDVTQPADLQALARYVQPLGAIDYLVPNAGIAELAEGVQPQAFARQWAVNGDGALNTLAVLRGQLASPAAVVFIGTFLVQRSFLAWPPILPARPLWWPMHGPWRWSWPRRRFVSIRFPPVQPPRLSGASSACRRRPWPRWPAGLTSAC